MRIRADFMLIAVATSGGLACSQTSEPSPTPASTPVPGLAALQKAQVMPASRGPARGQLLPTGARITPSAAPGTTFQNLNPDLSSLPGFLADHAVTTALSPDGATLLVLTSGYNAITKPDNSGDFDPALSNEYVFVYDVSQDPPLKRQVLEVPNTFVGMAWNPNGQAFYVSGGVDDNLHIFTLSGNAFVEVGAPIALGHSAGLGLEVPATAGGVGIDESGMHAVVANYENDSVSIVDLASSAVTDVDLRPGKADAAQAGVPGGEYPYWVVCHAGRAYVSSQRDREVVVVDVAGKRVVGRIPVGAQPNKMLLAHDLLFVANSGDDTVSVVDLHAGRAIDQIPVAAPAALLQTMNGLSGANPNSLALAPDGRTLYVTNGGLNAVSVVALKAYTHGPRGWNEDGDAEPASHVVGLIPTGWYPESISLSADGRSFFVVNGKSITGAGCLDVASTTAYDSCWNGNDYVWQLEKAGLLSGPVPSSADLARLTLQVAYNDNFPIEADPPARRPLMAFLRQHIKHVIYVIKENRTYDQVLGDLPRGNGDASLALFPEAITPNHHALARLYVTLDSFQDTGETSGVGWNWTVSARTTDSVEKTQPPNYAGRGLNYDWEGTNRNINVGVATLAERVALDPATPTDPDLLPGTADVASGDPASGEAPGESYLWDAAMRKGLEVRNYGCFGDLDALVGAR